jgi:outer membrane protein assembly factor BamB
MDAELRTLERAALAGGARARLAWARGLERAGRGDEGVAALLEVRDDPAVRRHLEALPAWSHREADAGRTNFVAARPVARGPQVVWKTDVLPGHGAPLLASPLALAWPGDDHIVALDPRTGESHRVECRGAPGTLVELRLARLVVEARHDLREVALDLLSGASHVSGRVSGLACVRDRDLVVRGFEGLVTGSWIAVDEKTRRRQWRYPRKGSLDRELRDGIDLCVGPTRVVLWGAGPFVLLERETGREVARGHGDSIRLDALGLAAVEERSVFALDANGRRLWARDLRGAPTVTALAPDFVVVLVGKKTFALDRRTGETIGQVGESLKTLAVVGDVVYLTSFSGRHKKRLCARRTNGEELWSLEIADHLEALAALDGRLFVAVTKTRPWATSILCLAEPAWTPS